MWHKQTSLLPLALLVLRRTAAKRARSARIWSYSLVTSLLVFAVAFSSQAYAQSYFELEPNNTCGSAQSLLSAAFPLQVEGFKTQPFSDALDFYRFSSTPGTQVRVTLDGDLSKPNPLTAFGLGLFTSDCPAAPTTSAFTIFSAVNLEFTVPPDGIFVIGVTACCDTNFSGSGTIEGAYVLSVASNATVDSISGQVRDRLTGRPLAGAVEPFARVQLYRSSPFGFQFEADIPTDENGRYTFTSAVVGSPLSPGDYQVVGFASQYQTTNNSIDLANVQAHEARAAPVLNLLSNPVRITDVNPCNAISALGGKCDFSYTATVGTPDLMKGVVWSLVKAWGTGGLINATEFLACEDPLTLVPGKGAASSAVVRCRFTVPASVPDNAIFCPDARFGEGSRSNPHFAVQGLVDPLFCITKLPGQSSFQVLPQPAAVQLKRHKESHR